MKKTVNSKSTGKRFAAMLSLAASMCVRAHMRRACSFMLLAMASTGAFAGDADNIGACVKKANEFASVKLDEFAAVYEGKIFSMSTATWKNAYCEVKLGEVYNLTVNGKEYLYQGYAGRESYNLHLELEEKTDAAINQLRSRIALLEDRMSRTNVSLKKANPDHGWLTSYIDEGINRARGDN